MKKIASHLRACAILLAAGYTIAVPILVGIGKLSISAATLMLISSILLVILVHFNQVVEVSLGPLRAEMREVLGDTEEVLHRLRSIIKIISRMSLGQTMMSNLWLGNIPVEKQFQMYDEICKMLKKLDISEDELRDEVDDIWRDGIKIIYLNLIFKELLNVSHVSGNPSNEEQEKKLQAQREVFIGRHTASISNSQELRRYIYSCKLNSDSVEQWLIQYEHFEASDKVTRRSELFEALRPVDRT